ncbi:MAG: DivIVA domain-containing protein [Vicinamibacteria bacterium]
MKISPMDVQRQTFAKRLRGFDPDEVRSYLTLLSEELADFQREHAALQQEVQSLRELLDEHRQREQMLKNTLLTAQRVSEEIRETSRKQAEATVKEAELQADRLIELAQSRARSVEKETLDLRAMRQGLREDIRSLVTRLVHVLDLQEEAEVEDNLRFLKRREETGS